MRPISRLFHRWGCVILSSLTSLLCIIKSSNFHSEARLMFIVWLKLKMAGNGVSLGSPPPRTNPESKLLASFQRCWVSRALCISYLINPQCDPRSASPLGLMIKSSVQTIIRPPKMAVHFTRKIKECEIIVIFFSPQDSACCRAALIFDLFPTKSFILFFFFNSFFFGGMSQAFWLSVTECDGVCGHVQRKNSLQSIYFPWWTHISHREGKRRCFWCLN